MTITRDDILPPRAKLRLPDLPRLLRLAVREVHVEVLAPRNERLGLDRELPDGVIHRHLTVPHAHSYLLLALGNLVDGNQELGPMLLRRGVSSQSKESVRLVLARRPQGAALLRQQDRSGHTATQRFFWRSSVQRY